MRRAFWPAVPLVAGVVTALGLWLWRPDLRLVVRVGLPVVALTAGALLTLALVAVLARRRAVDRAARRGRDEARAEAQREHHRFVARLDHELKNPLAAISLAVTNLEQAGGEETAHDEGTQRTLRGVRHHVDRLTTLVTDLRKLNDLTTAELESERVDPVEVLREVRQTLTEVPAYSSRQVELQVHETPWPVGPVEADRELLFVAFYNVVLNALKYSTDGVVHVLTRSDGQEVTIEVSDTGIGVPGQDLDTIWRELSRGSNVAHLPGSGLGLPLVSRIVDLHRGTVGARSEEGVGTRVEISLPLAR